MKVEEFKNQVLSQFTLEITDVVFQYIENDRDLLQEYLRVVGRASDIDETNKRLGKAVKEWFGLENGDRNHEPKSKLIRSYTEHTKQ